MQIISPNTSTELSPIPRQFPEKSDGVPVNQTRAEQQGTEVSPKDPQIKAEKLAKLQDTLSEHDISLKFSKDVQTNAVIVELIDSETGEAINQFPSEVSLKLSASFTKLQGQFIDKQG